jgi:hypothetical protein
MAKNTDRKIKKLSVRASATSHLEAQGKAKPSQSNKEENKLMGKSSSTPANKKSVVSREGYKDNKSVNRTASSAKSVNKSIASRGGTPVKTYVSKSDEAKLFAPKAPKSSGPAKKGS